MAVQKLELTWVGKNKPVKLEPRLLLEVPEKSYHAKTKRDGDIFENMLIHGDNLLALKALEAKFTGKVKCIFIDPPYNTGAAFEHYDDNLEHSIWLSLMRARIVLLRNLLSDDGFFCCEIDDSEGCYLKVLLDEIFGRENYLSTMYIRVRYPDKTLKEDMAFHKEIEQIHVYQKTNKSTPNNEKKNIGFDKFNLYIKELSAPSKVITLGGKKVEIFEKGQYEIEEKEGSVNGLKEVWASGTILDGNSSGRFFRDYLTGRSNQDGLGVLYKVEGIGDDQFPYRYFTGPQRETATKGKYYQGVPVDKIGADKNIRSLPINNFYDFAGYFGNCRSEGKAAFRGGKKPEILLETLLNYFSNPGDLVLDSFLGSGTTAAVAHKMGRRWIGIELGEHCETLCYPRLKDIVDGLDQGGVSKKVNWQGGGGFRFYELAPSLIKKDDNGLNVIDSEHFDDVRLAEAVCKIMGFDYNPSQDEYFIHGQSTEKAFIYVTTNFMTAEHIQSISRKLGSRHLSILCKAFETVPADCENVTVKKIPKEILEKCEWGCDDYSLNVKELPVVDQEEQDLSLF